MSRLYDHRQLGDEMELYFFDEQIGSGLVNWLPNGVAIRDSLEKFMRYLESQDGYQRVVSPHLAKSDLYERSGHLRAFAENMYPPLHLSEHEKYFLKPMNCPHHHKAFAALPRSYRCLPLRIAEYGQVYRYEDSGALKGLSRVRGLCQNDAHIYVDPAQIKNELLKVLDLHERCYKLLGLQGYRYRLSLGDANNKHNYDGGPADWQIAESVLRECLIEKKLEYFEAIGEAAFYGPKIDVQMAYANQKEESIASVQIDFNAAEKFDLNFVSSSGEKKRPWVIHRAPLGSHERFVALLLEYYQGKLPGWLAPVQVLLLPVDDKSNEECERLAGELRCKEVRVHVNDSSESLSKRIFMSHRQRPFLKVVIGSKEIEQGQFKLQFRDKEILISRSELLAKIVESLEIPLGS